MLCVDSFIFEKFDEAERVDVHYRKIFFVQLEKIFVLTMRNSCCDDFRIDLMNSDEIVNDRSDIFAELNLVEKKKVGL